LLPKINRANPAEITLVREEGKLISGSLFGLLVKNLTEQKPSRFAFIVSTKISKKAVLRNRIKRQLRTALRQLLSQIKKGQILLILAKKNLLERSQAEVSREVAEMLAKARVLN
jgi:ribonuclease P protein component